MKIFGREFKTRKELKSTITQLEKDVLMARNEWDIMVGKLFAMQEMFPFTLGQIVYDVQLRNENGRYAKKNASLEHSLINDVVVDTKNYFGLVKRFKRQDVFLGYECAKAYLESVCEKK